MLDDENQRKGLPDAVIYAEEQCLIIESKVSSTLTKDQLVRHEKTVRRRGFNSIRGIGIVVDLLPNVRLDNWKQITWNQVYSWAYKETNKSEWARKLIDYFKQFVFTDRDFLMGSGHVLLLVVMSIYL